MTGRLDVVRAAAAKLTVDAPEHEAMKGTIDRMLERVSLGAGLIAARDGEHLHLF